MHTKIKPNEDEFNKYIELEPSYFSHDYIYANLVLISMKESQYGTISGYVNQLVNDIENSIKELFSDEFNENNGELSIYTIYEEYDESYRNNTINECIKRLFLISNLTPQYDYFEDYDKFCKKQSEIEMILDDFSQDITELFNIKTIHFFNNENNTDN